VASAGFEDLEPATCLVNRYQAKARLSLHQDKNERDSEAPIVSVSPGISAIFLRDGLRRGDNPVQLQ
jgi:DNA oxidative demethylase